MGNSSEYLVDYCSSEYLSSVGPTSTWEAKSSYNYSFPAPEIINPFSVVDASVRQNRFALIAPLTLVCVKNYFYFFSFAFRPLKPIKSIS